jgi:hypothetical protein
MATIDNITPLFPTKPKTPAERARAYRERKREKAKTDQNPSQPGFGHAQTVLGMPKTPKTPVTGVKPANAQTDACGFAAPAKPARSPASIALAVAAFGLAGVGITMNGWFARSLGSSDIAGWLFLAVGVAADLVALAIPSCAASQWHARQRGTAMAAWAIWLMTFAFAVNAGIGFASVNISDVTMARASRVTPAVTAAQTALADVTAARDRECKGGVGKFCREREAAVTERRQALDAAMLTVEHSADPQTEAASRIVAWLSFGTMKPSGDDFAMLRLILLALLPQIGGVLLMIGRR